jgi:hypothetical protein
MEINPQVVFERLFGDGSTPDERAARRRQDRSILDSVSRTLARFKLDVGSSDRARVDQYLEDVREIERRLDIAARASTAAPEATMPYGVPESFDEHIRLQFDLLALAFRADITRVSTLLYARDLTGRSYPESGTNISFHGGSHHAEDPQRIAEYARLNRYHVQMLAYFLDKLARTPDGDATLLDQVLVLYGSNMGNSNTTTCRTFWPEEPPAGWRAGGTSPIHRRRSRLETCWSASSTSSACRSRRSATAQEGWWGYDSRIRSPVRRGRALLSDRDIRSTCHHERARRRRDARRRGRRGGSGQGQG